MSLYHQTEVLTLRGWGYSTTNDLVPYPQYNLDILINEKNRTSFIKNWYFAPIFMQK